MSAAAVMMPDRNTAMTPVRKALADSGIVISFGDTDWKFAPDTMALKHFWSTNGIECLWCKRQRSADEIQAWREGGEPKEECPA